MKRVLPFSTSAPLPSFCQKTLLSTPFTRFEKSFEKSKRERECAKEESSRKTSRSKKKKKEKRSQIVPSA